MKKESVVDELGIAIHAEVELWGEIRDETRRKLMRSATLGAFYLLSSFTVGAYLLRAIAKIFEESNDLLSWSYQKIDMAWINQLAWGYDVAFFSVAILYVTTLLAIRNWLPCLLCPVSELVPGIGSTLRVVSLGEFCQSLYLSVLQEYPYAIALDRAANSIGNPALRRWSSNSSKRISSGQSVSQALVDIPIIDLPLSAVTALTSGGHTESNTISTWRLAALDCHRLAQSRLQRSTQVISVFCIAVSALSASMALSFSLYLLSSSLSAFGF